MFGMGWSEMVVVGIVALIVVGPKDLPGMFKTMGEFTGKARGMAREFNKAMNAAADDAGVKDISKTIKAAANPKAMGLDKLREATKLDLDLDPDSATGKMAAQREASRQKLLDANAAKAAARKAQEADAAAEAVKPVTPAPTPDASKSEAKAKSEAKE